MRKIDTRAELKKDNLENASQLRPGSSKRGAKEGPNEKSGYLLECRQKALRARVAQAVRKEGVQGVPRRGGLPRRARSGAHAGL